MSVDIDKLISDILSQAEWTTPSEVPTAVTPTAPAKQAVQVVKEEVPKEVTKAKPVRALTIEQANYLAQIEDALYPFLGAVVSSIGETDSDKTQTTRVELAQKVLNLAEDIHAFLDKYAP